MPGANYVTQGQGVLDKLLNQPIPGLYSAGQDQLSQQYEQETQGGMSDIASRGLTTTGAVPSLYTNAGAQYQTGTLQNVAQGQMAQNAQKLSILQSLLGLGQNALTTARSGALSGLMTQDVAGDLLGGTIGYGTGFLSQGGIPGLLTSLGIW